MAKTSTSWGAGKSGNPKGRPRKGRTLTDALREGGERKVYNDMGHLMPAREVLAMMIWELVMRGYVSAGGNMYQLYSIDEWLKVVQWLYAHVDGGAELESVAAGQAGEDEEIEMSPEMMADETLEEMKKRLSMRYS